MSRKRSVVPRKDVKLPAKDVYRDGAESMLRCYNATEWRLEDWFKEEDQPPQKTPKPLRHN